MSIKAYVYRLLLSFRCPILFSTFGYILSNRLRRIPRRRVWLLYNIDFEIQAKPENFQ